MDKSIRELLCDEVAAQLESLPDITPGSKEHEEAVKSIVALHGLIMNERKLELEDEAKMYEDRHKEAQRKQDKLFQWVHVGLEAAGIIVPTVFYAALTMEGFRFEEKNTVTSHFFKGVLNRCKPTK